MPLALREDVVSTGLWFVLLHLQKVFFALSSGKNNNETQSSHSGKIPEKFPKNNLQITTKIRTSQIKYAIFKISKFFFIFIETFLYLATEHYTLFGYQNFQAYPRGYEEC